MKRLKFSDWLLVSALLVGSALSSPNAHATRKVDNNYEWRFFTERPWPEGYNQATGKPEGMAWARNEYPSDFFKRIRNALPEGKVNEAFMTDNNGSTIHLKEEGEVFITFVHEGAGYRNAFGYFTFDRENPPQHPSEVQETIVFPNLSFPHMTNGHRVSLGTFPKDTSIGFFIAANGFWYYTGVKPFKVPYYYSLSHLNPESSPELRQHNVLLLDDDVEEVIIGFEDLPRNRGDNDFNDAVFSVKVTPYSALETEQLVQMPDANDSDADGIADSEDEFPNDYRRAYSSFYPGPTDYVTLAFEDNYPNYGDYDLNDLVIRERLQTIYDANGMVTGFKVSGFIDARGAARANGFAVRMMDLPPELIEKAHIIIDGERYEKRTEDYQTDAVFLLWRNTKVFTSTGNSGKCSHFNTVVECESFDPVPFEFDVQFAYGIDQLNHSALDFFIFRSNDRGHEVHFAGYPGTNFFKSWLYGHSKDASNPTQGKFFVSDDGLPWALKIESEWKYPREYIDVVWAYPRYEAWVESAGTVEKDWYKNTTRTAHVFEK